MTNQRTFPPQPTVHAADCAYAPVAAITTNAAVLAAFPYARPHYCIPGGFTQGVGGVKIEPADYPDHAYQTSMIWPANTARALCFVCRGSHDAEANR